MYLKLALRNIRRSVRDYAVYFITLLFGVAVFYAFNSIGSQQILFDMETSASRSVFDSTTYILGMFSVVVACVLGFLILYANQFLIRRRKREFGTYLVLGMTPGHVSRIVLYETVLVGMLSLAVGLICGVLLSQGLSFFTAALFGTTMTNYQFVFSPDAFLVTLACFAAIYVVVAAFNTITVSRCKLIDLIRAGEKNERAGVRNPWVCLVGFVAAIAILAYAYEQLIENGLVMLDQPEFLRATIGMLVGSLLFFLSLAGLRHRRAHADARRVPAQAEPVHHTPDRQQGEHGVSVAVGRVCAAVLLHHGVLLGHGACGGVRRRRGTGEPLFRQPGRGRMVRARRVGGLVVGRSARAPRRDGRPRLPIAWPRPSPTTGTWPPLWKRPRRNCGPRPWARGPW